jgi:hypothetical protein
MFDGTSAHDASQSWFAITELAPTSFVQFTAQ